MFFWYLWGIFLIGPTLQQKLHHVQGGFSLVCYLVIDKSYFFKNNLLCTKIALKILKKVIFVGNTTLTWCPMPVDQWYIWVWSSFHAFYATFVNNHRSNWIFQFSWVLSIEMYLSVCILFEKYVFIMYESGHILW